MKISSNDIVNELKELSPLLAGLERIDVFTIPDGYFDGIAAAVLVALRAEENSLPVFSGESTFGVPAGYFESLAGNILAKIKSGEITATDELRELSAMLYSIQNENVYKVPKGYFDGVAENILKEVQPQQAKVVRMGKRNGFLKTAVAASIVTMLAFGIYKVDKNFGSAPNTQVALLDPSILQGKNMGDLQFNATLDSLSTQEIASYLEKHNDEGDVASLTSSLDVNSIPSQDDYIVDDKTLDNYLQELKTSSLKN
jgi:hypothetical protein